MQRDVVRQPRQVARVIDGVEPVLQEAWRERPARVRPHERRRDGVRRPSAGGPEPRPPPADVRGGSRRRVGLPHDRGDRQRCGGPGHRHVCGDTSHAPRLLVVAPSAQDRGRESHPQHRRGERDRSRPAGGRPSETVFTSRLLPSPAGCSVTKVRPSRLVGRPRLVCLSAVWRHSMSARTEREWSAATESPAAFTARKGEGQNRRTRVRTPVDRSPSPRHALRGDGLLVEHDAEARTLGHQHYRDAVAHLALEPAPDVALESYQGAHGRSASQWSTLASAMLTWRSTQSE